jgi:hypothetical protein
MVSKDMQLTLLDIIEDITGVNHCSICGQPCKMQECSDECRKKWIIKYIDNGLK